MWLDCDQRPHAHPVKLCNEAVQGVAGQGRGRLLDRPVHLFYGAGVGDRSAIEWTDATWNPVTGCAQLSPGCDHCYALTFAERFRGVPGHPYEQGFDLRLWPERLDRPPAVGLNLLADQLVARPEDLLSGAVALGGAHGRGTFDVGE